MFKVVKITDTGQSVYSYFSYFCRPTLAAIAEEWNQVPTVGVNGSNGQVICTMLITVDEAFCHLRSSDLPEPAVSLNFVRSNLITLKSKVKILKLMDST